MSSHHKALRTPMAPVSRYRSSQCTSQMQQLGPWSLKVRGLSNPEWALGTRSTIIWNRALIKDEERNTLCWTGDYNWKEAQWASRLQECTWQSARQCHAMAIREQHITVLGVASSSSREIGKLHLLKTHVRTWCHVTWKEKNLSKWVIDRSLWSLICAGDSNLFLWSQSHPADRFAQVRQKGSWSRQP